MWIEKPEKRTQKSKTFYDEETKKYRAEFTIHDRHFKNDNDQWEDVDETLEDDTGNFNKKCDKTRHIFQVTQGGVRRWYPRRNILTEYVDITGMQYYDNQWRNLNLPAAVWKSQEAEWDMSYLYASITNTWKRIKSDFIMKNVNCPTRLRFAVSFTGLTYNDTTGELTSTTDGLVWGYIDKPTAHDANDVEVIITQTYSGGYIEWSVDTTGATLPIYIDPTFTDGYGGDVTTYQDTYLISTNSDKSFGGDTTFVFAGLLTVVGLLKFDLSSIPSNSTCDTATLSLYNTETKPSNRTLNINELLLANDGWVDGITEDPATGNQSTWDYKIQTGSGTGTAWAGSPGCGTEDTDFTGTEIGTGSYTANDPAGTLVSSPNGISLTAADVEDWFGASNANYGLRLIAITSTFPSVASSDHATTGYRPKLVVEYTESSTEIKGSTAWGQTTGAQEGNVRTFSGNWTGTGVISGSGNSEKILLSTGNYMQSEIVNTGANSIQLLQNRYSGGDTGILKYRSGSNVINCEAAGWEIYSGSFASFGYTQIRVEKAWWLTEGITNTDVVAAYQPKGASSYANSLHNLVENIYDAIDDGGDTSPGWDAIDGWKGLLGNYLRSDIIPAIDQSWSMLVRFLGANHTGVYVNGSGYGGPPPMQFFGIFTDPSSNTLQFLNGGSRNIDITTYLGVAGWAGNKIYYNGILQLPTIPLGDAEQARGVDLIGFNGEGGHQGNAVCILAEVWYNKILTPTQMATISSQMAAL